MSVRDKLRERADQRIFALETLRTVIEWINSTNPQSIYQQQKEKGSAATLTDEEFRQRFRDWLNASGDFIAKANELPTLLIEDSIKIMKEITEHAEPKTASESK